MDYETLKNEWAAAQLAVVPHKKKLATATEKYKKDCQVINDEFVVKMEQYLDTRLLDRNNTIVNKGDKICNMNKLFVVIERGMQFVLGEVLNNPRVVCRKIDVAGNIIGKTDQHIFPSELKEFTIFK